MNTNLNKKELLIPKVDVIFHALFREENKELTESLISDILGEPVKLKTTDLNRHLNIKTAEQKGIDDLDIKWQIRDNKTGKRLLTEDLEIMLVEIPKAKRFYKKNKQNKICQWMLFLDDPNQKEMKEIMEENTKIKEAVEELETMSEDEELRRIADLRLKGERDEKSRLLYAKEQGETRGIQIGEERGLKKGRAEGRTEEKIEIAKKMLLKNVPIEDVIDFTGLTKEEIENLK